MHELARVSATARTPEQLTATLTTVLQAVLPIDQVHLSEVSQGQELSRGTVTAAELPDASPAYVLVLDERPSGIAHVLATGETLHVPDARSSTVIRQDLVERWNAASVLWVPMSWGGEVRQVVVLISHVRRSYTATEIALAEALMGQAAAGLALLESERARSDGADQDRALARAALALNASLDLEAVLETLAREADRAVSGTITGVYLADGTGGGIATAGHNVPADWRGYRIGAGEGVAGRVLESGRSWVTNAYQQEVTVPAHPALRDLQTAVGVPMAWGGELKGALSVGFAEMRRITEADLGTLQAIAELAVAACRNAEAYEQARAAASTDALTGLLNHGALHARAREEVARARRDGTHLACLLLDLDEFKAVNDEHGHLAGDGVLRDVAAALRTELRDYDLLARYGGDEFVLLLPGARASAASLVAERVRRALASVAGCSVGIAEWFEPLSADELLERADRALLLAKRTGKGRIRVAGAELEQELELLGAPEGSPAAVMREFWELVAGCDMGVQTEPADRDAPAGAYAAVPLLGSGAAGGLFALRARRAVPLERLRLAELLARQVTAIVAARTEAGLPAAVQALAAAIEARDNYTHEHSEQVVRLAAAVASGLGLGRAELERVRHGALLHDVGKLAIPNDILHKPGPLTEAEWRVMAEHPAIGERILRRTPQLAQLAPIVRHEHERWDGGGYPDGLAGTAIPVASRIILACDAYNAMITTRPYREAMPPAHAIAELRAGSGTQFDPDVVAALLAALSPLKPAR